MSFSFNHCKRAIYKPHIPLRHAHFQISISKWNGTISSYIVLKPVSIWWISWGIQYYSTVSLHLYGYKQWTLHSGIMRNIWKVSSLWGNVQTQSVYHQMYINGHIVSLRYAGKDSIANATVCRGCISRISVCFDYVSRGARSCES